jgi:DNA polymerase III subunit epsilon
MPSIFFHIKKLYYLRLSRSKRLPPVIRDYLNACLSLDMRESIRNTDFVILDTETTGLSARKGDRIVSISAVRLQQGRIDLSRSFHALINPNRDIPSEASGIHGILQPMVAEKPALEEVLPRFVDYIGPSVVVGHHVWLDMTFLNREMRRQYGLSMQNAVLDTAILDQAFIAMGTPRAPKDQTTMNSTLSGLADRYRVTVERLHSSFGDALMTAQIFQVMMKEAERRGITSLRDLLRVAYHPPSINDHQQDGSTL